MRKKKSYRGFSLVELIAVIGILALLASVVLFNLQEAKKNARDAQRLSDLQQIQLALRVYKDTHGNYPSYDAGDKIGDSVGFDVDVAEYLSSTIKDPLNTGTFAYYYDSAYTCGGIPHVVLVALTMEQSKNQNWNSVCNGTELIAGATPNANSYVLILR